MPGDNFFYHVRDWLLSDQDLADLFGWDPVADPTKLKPFFPAQQFPETEFPYVRYNTMNSVSSNNPWMHTGDVYMFLWFDEIDDAQACANIITDMCSYGDESAGELERWLSINDIVTPYHYHSIVVPAAGEVEPTSERSGAHAYALNLSVEYSPKESRDRYAYARNA